MTAYVPHTAWINGGEVAHPSFQTAWANEVRRLLKVVDSPLVVADRELRNDYDRWYADPRGYLDYLDGLRRAAETTALTLAEHGAESIAVVDPGLCLSRPLWREPVAQRKVLARRFVGQRVRVERWLGRVAANGDQVYTGVVVAVAVSTLGSAADLLILHTDEGTTWAISLAQIAAMEEL